MQRNKRLTALQLIALTQMLAGDDIPPLEVSTPKEPPNAPYSRTKPWCGPGTRAEHQAKRKKERQARKQARRKAR